MTENIDLLPDVRRAGGRARPPNADGRSLVPLLRGRTGRATGATRCWSSIAATSARPTDPDLPPAGSGNPPTYEALRSRRTALYVEYADGERELYDLASDPFELRNAYRDLDQAQREKLIERLDELRYCRGRVSCFRAGR